VQIVLARSLEEIILSVKLRYVLVIIPNYIQVQHIIKGKAIPLQAWTGPEGSRRLRLQDFKTIGT